MNKNSFENKCFTNTVKKPLGQLAQANFDGLKSRDYVTQSRDHLEHPAYTRACVPRMSTLHHTQMPKGAAKGAAKRSCDRAARRARGELLDDIASAVVLCAGAVFLIGLPLIRFYLGF